MEVRTLGKAIWVKDLAACDIFVYKVDAGPALGIFLKRNAYGYAAVALTHAPGEQKTLPSLMSDQFLSKDGMVFAYEQAYILAGQQFAHLNGGQPEAGAIISSATGTLLRCRRDGTDYEVDLATGELKNPGHAPIFWTRHWAIKDRFGNPLFER
jgi:hypothetical protein